MITIGLYPSNTGSKGGKTTGDQMSHYILDNGPFSNVFRGLVTQGFHLEWVEKPVLMQSVEIPKAIGSDDTDDRDATVTISLDDPAPLLRQVDTSKMKYTCPECGLNAWAKMGANLVCGDCDEDLVLQNY